MLLMDETVEHDQNQLEEIRSFDTQRSIHTFDDQFFVFILRFI